MEILFLSSRIVEGLQGGRGREFWEPSREEACRLEFPLSMLLAPFPWDFVSVWHVHSLQGDSWQPRSPDSAPCQAYLLSAGMRPGLLVCGRRVLCLGKYYLSYFHKAYVWSQQERWGSLLAKDKNQVDQFPLVSFRNWLGNQLFQPPRM